jgi:hypothetical protein
MGKNKHPKPDLTARIDYDRVTIDRTHTALYGNVDTELDARIELTLEFFIIISGNLNTITARTAYDLTEAGWELAPRTFDVIIPGPAAPPIPAAAVFPPVPNDPYLYPEYAATAQIKERLRNQRRGTSNEYVQPPRVPRSVTNHTLLRPLVEHIIEPEKLVTPEQLDEILNTEIDTRIADYRKRIDQLASSITEISDEITRAEARRRN